MLASPHGQEDGTEEHGGEHREDKRRRAPAPLPAVGAVRSEAMDEQLPGHESAVPLQETVGVEVSGLVADVR
jgi:hypothetical protein